jgi:60 kDa SS-A/Ro ribonucleoprotein
VVGMTATQFSIADPKDAGMLDVVGFDGATPNIISSFAKGEF